MGGINRIVAALQCQRRLPLAAIRLHDNVCNTASLSTRYFSSSIAINPSLQYNIRMPASSKSIRCLSSSTTNSSPSDAGMAAYEIRRAIETNKSNQYKISMATHLSHAGLSRSNNNNSSNIKSFNSPLSPSIDLATTYERPPSGHYGEDGMIYSRSCNPTRKLLEDTIGQLEMTSSSTKDQQLVASTFAFSSGMAAVSSLLLACKSQVKLLMPIDVYHGLSTQLKCLNDHGIVHKSVDMTNITKIRQQIKEYIASGDDGCIVVWLETPSNPLCQVTDIKEVCNLVHEMDKSQHGEGRIMTVVDSTWAPPCVTQPLHLGADAVLHSGTKYLGGHSDVLLGVVSCSPLTENGEWLAERIKAVQVSIGAVASPLECWLTLRGLRTLHLRVQRQCDTAMQLAQYLNGHKNVKKCHYPGLKSHPQHAIAKQQMLGNKFGGMLSFEVESESMAMAVAGAVNVIRRATSLGGTETLIEHRKSIEPEGSTCPAGLLRLSIGLEAPADLQHDLEIALEVASSI